MGRGRTTTGMILASLIATIDRPAEELEEVLDEVEEEEYDEDDKAESARYLNGEATSSRLTCDG
jgi:hypothetical protein